MGSYNPDTVSLPSGLRPAVDLAAALGEGHRDCLDPDILLEDEDIAKTNLEENPITIYTDDILRQDVSAYLAFVRRLAGLGLLSFTTTRRSRVAPFFVSKKKGKQRLVWDCRAANQLFRPPPGIDMGAAESLQRIVLETDEELYCAQADVQNCFYQCGLPAWISDYFAMDAVPGALAKELGFQNDVHGVPLDVSREVFPCLTVLPMGWSWAFWMVQRLHEQACMDCGFEADDRLAGCCMAGAECFWKSGVFALL